MAKIQVTVNYRQLPGGKVQVDVNPRVAKVNQGDVVQFTRGGTAPGKMKITFERGLFSRDALEGDGPITVAAKLRARTTYRCELFDDRGILLGSADGAAGGAFEPAGN